MKVYSLKHHQEIAGVKNQLFADEAILAIHQGSGGLLRRANNLARGALIAATREKGKVVSADMSESLLLRSSDSVIRMCKIR